MDFWTSTPPYVQQSLINSYGVKAKISMSKLRNSSDRRSWRQNGERQKYSVWILFSLLRCTARGSPLLLRRDRRPVSPHDFSIRPPRHRQHQPAPASSSQLLDRCSAGNSPSHHPPSRTSLAFKDTKTVCKEFLTLYSFFYTVSTTQTFMEVIHLYSKWTQLWKQIWMNVLSWDSSTAKYVCTEESDKCGI